MRKLYHEFFHISKQENIREKVMLVRTGLTVAITLFCLAAISITAFARFSYNITSHTTVIKAAAFRVNVAISVTEKEERSASVDVENAGDGTYKAKLKAGKVYTVTLSKGPESTASTGFCIVTAEGCADTFHTRQLGADASATGEYNGEITFELKVTADTTVSFHSHWGTSSYYAAYSEKGEDSRLYITDADVAANMVEMIIGKVAEPTDDEGTETEEGSAETEKVTVGTEDTTEAVEETTAVTEDTATETEETTTTVEDTTVETEEATTVTEDITTEVEETTTTVEDTTVETEEATTVTEDITTEVEETTVAATEESETTELVTQDTTPVIVENTTEPSEQTQAATETTSVPHTEETES